MDDSLIITYDYCPPDVPTLCVIRIEGDKTRIVNTIQGDNAIYLYAWLTGKTELIQGVYKQ